MVNAASMLLAGNSYYLYLVFPKGLCVRIKLVTVPVGVVLVKYSFYEKS